MNSKFKGYSTRSIHVGEDSKSFLGAVTQPIFQTSTYAYDVNVTPRTFRYTRLSNSPGHESLHAKIAALESGEDALVTSSGMAAIYTALLSHLRSGDHALFQSRLYSGAYSFIVNELGRLGIDHTFIDVLQNPADWEKHLKPNTKLFHVESISNPTMEVPDFESIVSFAKAHQLVTVIDNTLASPINFNPLQIGFDTVVHSCTKYMNGHSDLVAGAIVSSEVMILRAKRLLMHVGAILDPHACFLLQRGLKTLALRVARQNENALAVATFLKEQPMVKNTYYPGISSSSSFKNAEKYFRGFGGMLSIELNAKSGQVGKWINNLELFTPAPSLGGAESLIIHPWQTSHAGLSDEQKKMQGISEGLVRLSIGIEDIEDLIEDMRCALAKTFKKG